MAKLSAKNIAIAYGSATVGAVSSGLVGAYLLGKVGYRPDYGLTVAATWFTVVGVPTMVASADQVLVALGKKRPIDITMSPGSLGRKVPINLGDGRQSHVFLSSFGLGESKREPLTFKGAEVPMTFFVGGHVVTLPEVDLFIRVAFSRQRVGKPGLSREYWTRRRAERWSRPRYKAVVSLLEGANVIQGRGERRAGRLVGSPNVALDAVKRAWA